MQLLPTGFSQTAEGIQSAKFALLVSYAGWIE